MVNITTHDLQGIQTYQEAIVGHEQETFRVKLQFVNRHQVSFRFHELRQSGVNERSVLHVVISHQLAPHLVDLLK